MFPTEAAWVGAALSAFDAEALSPLLNVGASTRTFRTEIQPWIHEEIVAPLEARGVRVVHLDLKEGDGVDIAADILSDEGLARAKAVGARALTLCNILEHVVDPADLARRAQALVAPGGILVVTGPRSYPHHRDPIDTMFRPTPQEMAALFSGCEVLLAEELATGSYRDQVRARPWLLLRPLFRLPFPFLGWAKWKRSMGRLYWLFNPYLVSCVVLRTPRD
ncbi:MAG: hypothetical protein Q8M88_00935 [Phenylobacterium sp.]|uniref:hypothetical protein n=1 Tax=Phenylobacterium sp. TaxID=1871053 RepID=UPI002736F500|nr:hypothetical protein [Phenylobacterium sp.]MDP3172982.1 hypothetical protein [Phenylobacterium sp.]